MANEEAALPERCPNCNMPQDWVLQAPWEFYSCEAMYGQRKCKWPINKWTPASDSYASAQVWVDLWKQVWGNV